jgi:hypothetical protein
MENNTTTYTYIDFRAGGDINGNSRRVHVVSEVLPGSGSALISKTIKIMDVGGEGNWQVREEFPTAAYLGTFDITVSQYRRLLALGKAITKEASAKKAGAK